MAPKSFSIYFSGRVRSRHRIRAEGIDLFGDALVLLAADAPEERTPGILAREAMAQPSLEPGDSVQRTAYPATGYFVPLHRAVQGLDAVRQMGGGLAEHEEIGAGPKGEECGLLRPVSLRNRPHLQVVRHDESLEPDPSPQLSPEDPRAERGRPFRVELGVSNVSGHDEFQGSPGVSCEDAIG